VRIRHFGTREPRQREGGKARIGERGDDELSAGERVAVALVEDQAAFARAIGRAPPEPPERAIDQQADVDRRQRGIADVDHQVARRRGGAVMRGVRYPHGFSRLAVQVVRCLR
jgi:hypothetical protein